MRNTKWRAQAVKVVIACAAHAVLAGSAGIAAQPSNTEMQSGASAASDARMPTVADILDLREVVSLQVAPSGGRYAVLVLRADVEQNTYALTWYLGEIGISGLRPLGDAGAPPPPQFGGGVTTLPGMWSPDGRTFAFLARHQDRQHLWIVRSNGQRVRRIRSGDDDVTEFHWSGDSRRILFRAALPRTRPDLQATPDYRSGYNLQQFQTVDEIVHGAPEQEQQLLPGVSVVGTDGVRVRAATPGEQQEFDDASSRQGSHLEALGAAGHRAWVQPETSGIVPLLRLHASETQSSLNVVCAAPECSSQYFIRLWWRRDSARVLFWRREGTNVRSQDAIYEWDPTSTVIRAIFRSETEWLNACDLSAQQLICVRETVDRPPHVISIDLNTRALTELADLNPQFRQIHSAPAERIEWALPASVEQLGYPTRGYGFVFFPPSFDPSGRYPLVVVPYVASGFPRDGNNNEIPILALTANGFVVLASEFPEPYGGWARMPSTLALQYAQEEGFPHLRMLAASTTRAIDEVVSRGYIDRDRIGIGGVSQGAIVPMYIVQTEDRFSAVAVGSPGWSQFEYYATTAAGRQAMAALGANLNWPESEDYWSQIDIAHHAPDIEAPILLQYADREYFAAHRLPRRLEAANRAFEMYIFQDEFHTKYQPAHRLAVLSRNLDWFRFWLQDVEDTDPTKVDQYRRWRELRDLQCRNARSLRDYCAVLSRQVPIAR